MIVTALGIAAVEIRAPRVGSEALLSEPRDELLDLCGRVGVDALERGLSPVTVRSRRSARAMARLVGRDERTVSGVGTGGRSQPGPARTGKVARLHADA